MVQDNETDYIPHRESLELKELWFNEPCVAHYWSDGELSHPLNFSINRGMEQYEVSAPTYYQAFRFFRVAFGLYSYVSCNQNEITKI